MSKRLIFLYPHHRSGRDREVTLPRAYGLHVEGRRETESRQYGASSDNLTAQVTMPARKPAWALSVMRPVP